jgi:EAL domain-containing protein (putative c-di-GMP-specific phosphodiesterase class I)
MEKDITNDFPDAIRSEQFNLQLQPIFDDKDKCIGAEAFVYWRHPALGDESPQYFLKVLEDHSLIHVLDTYVIERAIRILRFWKDNGQEDKIISVNISTKDIYYMNIFEVVTGLVEKYGVNPSRLYLEFKETLLTADAENAKKLLRNLQKAGIKVGIDNFGRGYSSLNLLKDVQADFLKIDMLFLSESENEDRSYKILKFIVKLAKTLNMTVISQGVEQQAQYDILHQLDCEFMQGYYYSKPMSITEFEKTFMV